MHTPTLPHAFPLIFSSLLLWAGTSSKRYVPETKQNTQSYNPCTCNTKHVAFHKKSLINFLEHIQATNIVCPIATMCEAPKVRPEQSKDRKLLSF